MRRRLFGRRPPPADEASPQGARSPKANSIPPASSKIYLTTKIYSTILPLVMNLFRIYPEVGIQKYEKNKYDVNHGL